MLLCLFRGIRFAISTNVLRACCICADVWGEWQGGLGMQSEVFPENKQSGQVSKALAFMQIDQKSRAPVGLNCFCLYFIRRVVTAGVNCHTLLSHSSSREVRISEFFTLGFHIRRDGPQV